MKNNTKKNGFTNPGDKQEVKSDNPAYTKLNYRLAKQREQFGIATPEDKKIIKNQEGSNNKVDK